MKNIVICCDGTWNTPNEESQGVPTPTNVVRIYNAVHEKDAQGVPQHKYYHPGVGTDGTWWDKAIGGGTGRGLDKNIMSAYRELCDHYDPAGSGDRIYLFGFSRGAYTARSLAGFIARCGLLDPSGLQEPEIWNRIEHVFERGYRRRSEDRQVWDKKPWKFRNAANQSVPVHFLGVWDTVGALGIPNDMAFLNLLDNLHDYTFHNTDLSASVTHARHAVALDEVRATFQPTLWTNTDNRAKQMWFAGVHSDVGGGYRETGLSDAALRWMIDEAHKCDLAFDAGMLEQIAPNPRDVLHDSCRGAFSILATQPRSAPQFGADQTIHESALERQKKPPIHQCPYRPVRAFGPATPATFDVFAAQPWNATGIWLEGGKPYTFTAKGEWLDSTIKCGPGGTDDGHFQIAEAVQVLGTMWGKAENLFKAVTGNKSADFRLTKRHEDIPWFALVGAIANGGGVDAKQQCEAHEAFAIGNGCTYTPKKSGYFYAYANDAWGCYGNNRGHVELTVS